MEFWRGIFLPSRRRWCLDFVFRGYLLHISFLFLFARILAGHFLPLLAPSLRLLQQECQDWYLLFLSCEQCYSFVLMLLTSCIIHSWCFLFVFCIAFVLIRGAKTPSSTNGCVRSKTPTVSSCGRSSLPRPRLFPPPLSRSFRVQMRGGRVEGWTRERLGWKGVFPEPHRLWGRSFRGRPGRGRSRRRRSGSTKRGCFRVVELDFLAPPAGGGQRGTWE